MKTLDDSSEEPFRLRGHRVMPLTEQKIYSYAQGLADKLEWKRNSFNASNIEHTLQTLEVWKINIDVIDDHEWISLTRAIAEPDQLLIRVPNQFYKSLTDGLTENVWIMLHELGHIFLGHRAGMHFADKHPQKQEDSEWQADVFADAIAEYLKLPGNKKQLELKFEENKGQSRT
ncbi:ImmA/IrrE family metallo-endopeptidase [Vreelandella lionensis]|uniref:ImmA/IrrE family metallo-endopeptidase n=1 Tax=Vreelandella lionensis TaxID=1144478 RepID=UPI00111C1EBD|nr:ImmA/IrrE family metallo-endopeptidase [Halomonas lionensis]